MKFTVYNKRPTLENSRAEVLKREEDSEIFLRFKVLSKDIEPPVLWTVKKGILHETVLRLSPEAARALLVNLFHALNETKL